MYGTIYTTTQPLHLLGSPRYISRIYRRLQRMGQATHLVTMADDELAPDQLQLLHAMADHQEQEMRECLLP